MNIQYLDTGKRMSQATIHAGTVYTAGQVAGDPSADAAGQTRQILEAIDALLKSAGTSREHLLSTTVWLADMADFEAMNGVWDEWVVQGRAPTRACVESRLAGPQWKVEIRVTAALPE